MTTELSQPNELAPDSTPDVDTATHAGKPWPLGIIAFVLAALLAAVEAVAIYLASNGQPVIATVIGQALIVVTALPLALGVFAVIRRRDRNWGSAAIIVSIVANPLILLNILGFFRAL